MRVVATAGHVDHGKSALVRALTGMEPDRYEEERRRGLTLDLGFVWTRLEADGAGDGDVDGDGDGGEHLAFVDVPGHERFVATMLAGVGPVPAVLFVVAADQGWQPQSEEHLAILDALGVRHAVLAVTRSDLADPEPVRADAVERMAATSLGAVPSVAVSAVTGAGLDELRAELARMARALPVPPADADVRLWLDRAFTVRGHGTVVTGTLGAGTLRVGDRLVTADGAQPLRVRGLQCLQRDVDAVGGVARVAVNVHGAADDRLRRGQVLLTPGRWLTADVVDVRVAPVPAADLPREVTLHIGTAAVPVTVRPLGPDTARLTLRRALPLRVGDRAVLREPGGSRTPCGVTVLDVRPPRLARRGAARARAAELAALTGRPDGAAELRRRRLVRRPDLLAMGVPPPAGPVAGDWLADPDHWTGLRERLAVEVRRYAERHPLEPGLPTEAARRLLGLPDRCLVDALAAAPGTVPLRQHQGRLYGPGAARPVLPPPVRAAVDAVLGDLARAPFRAPEADRLAELGLNRKALAAAVAAGELLRVGDGIVLPPGADARAAAVLRRLPQPFTLSEARRALDTTRRVAVPLLEFLDARGYTERVDDRRRRCRPAAHPATETHPATRGRAESRRRTETRGRAETEA
ncbi:SelB C-terminal domain-containing protein [Streptomyces echinoruber]|uniref:Selenocysteine-specific translation elongation factor n=1 Tax=Streptomyces echinoruber TaxID=68898 RepID=A0A918V5J0_9ACTN|nr:selenocysteine-specific translation elongation factor [Streptomyces echinoruber]GGZ67952.1 selenocysteine-specific translation elongation factor [Streptomyces echinoruber]